MAFSYVLTLIGVFSSLLIMIGAVCLISDNKKIGVLLIALGAYLLMVTKGLI